MAWLKTPLHDPHPYWEPEWGLHLLRDEDDPRDKSTPIFGADDKFLEQELPEKLLTSCFGEHRKVFAICNNGTTAVVLAMANAASPYLIRLTGIGSYAGAFWSSMNLSSVPAEINDFYRRERTSLESIIPLPYITSQQMGTPWASDLEDVCLTALQERFLGFAMRGTPVGCILVELLLSGNGLQLSSRNGPGTVLFYFFLNRCS